MAAGSRVCDLKNAEVLKETIEEMSQDAAIANRPSNAAANNPSVIADPVAGLQKCCGRPRHAFSPATRPRIQPRIAYGLLCLVKNYSARHTNTTPA